MTETPRKRAAAWTLVVLVPFVAELAFGSTPMSMAWLTLVWMPIYGAGVLLIREAWVRSGRGWPALVLLGVAFELVEDGIGLQALTSPTLYGAAGWGVRPAGFNLPYWEANATYHTLFSLLVPIVLVTLLFPAQRRTPYLRTPGLVVTAVVAVLGVALLRLAVPPSVDPTYVAPVAVPIVCGVLAAGLAVVALRLLPRRPVRDPGAGPVPPPWAVGLGGLVATGVVLMLLWPVRGTPQPAFTHGAWVLAPMLGALVVLAAGGWLVVRLTGRAAWTDRHTALLVGGMLVAHSLAGIPLLSRSTFDALALVVVAVVTAGLVALLARRVQARVARSNSVTSSSA